MAKEDVASAKDKAASKVALTKAKASQDDVAKARSKLHKVVSRASCDVIFRESIKGWSNKWHQILSFDRRRKFPL